jgi:hypothetical protein
LASGLGQFETKNPPENWKFRSHQAALFALLVRPRLIVEAPSLGEIPISHLVGGFKHEFYFP